MFWWPGASGWGWLFMSVFMLAFWGLVVWAIVRAVGDGGRWRGPREREPGDPERILAERFARGEIDEAEYRDRLATLRSYGHTAV